MSKFKVGDTVRVIDSVSNLASEEIAGHIGEEYKVSSCNHNGPYISIDGLPNPHGGGWCYDRFELVSEEEGAVMYVVALEQDGRIASDPINCGYFPRESTAKLEAANCAAANPGRRYTIFRAIGHYETPIIKPVFTPR